MDDIEGRQQQNGGDNSHNIQAGRDVNINVAKNSDAATPLIERPTMRDIERFDPKINLLRRRIEETRESISIGKHYSYPSHILFSILKLLLVIGTLFVLVECILKLFWK